MLVPCEERRTPIQDLLDGELAGPARAELEAHLLGCAGCRAYQASMAGLFGELGALKAPGRAPQLDLDQVLAPQAPAVVPFRRKRAWAPWGAAAAAVLLAVGLTAPRLHQQVEVAASSPPAVTAADVNDEGQAILTWFGPEADSDDLAVPL